MGAYLPTRRTFRVRRGREISGRVLDIGCGRDNVFVTRYAHGNGVGVDVFRYEGLTDENIVDDMCAAPFPRRVVRHGHLHRVLQPHPEDRPRRRGAGGVSRAAQGREGGGDHGHPLAELAIHRLVYRYDKLLGTNLDMDTERGMHEDEEYLVRAPHRRALGRGGFRDIRKRYFVTQWGLNHLLTASTARMTRARPGPTPYG